MNLLLIEDNQKMAQNLKTVLRHHQYQVRLCFNGSEGVKKACQNQHDLIILDLNLPDIDGIEVCKLLREQEVKTPILMLTARIDLESKVSGLDQGADDYLTKPFATPELLARIRALLRRKSKCKSSKFKKRELKVDFSSRQAFLNQKSVGLTNLEWQILEHLCLNQGQVCEAADIIESVWGSHDQKALFSDSLKVHIFKIRSKLGKKLIKTVSGKGYQVL